MFPSSAHNTGTLPVSRPSSVTDEGQQTITPRPEGEGSSSVSPSGLAAYPSASNKGGAIRQEWDSIDRKNFVLPAELSSALEALPALKIICDDLIKAGWKIHFGPENEGSRAIDNKKEIIIDSKRKTVLADLLTTVAHEMEHAQYNWTRLMNKRLEKLLLGEQLSEEEYILSCAKNEGHSMFAEFRLLAMCEDNPGLQQEIDDHLKKKYGSREGTGNTDAAYQKGMTLYRQWRASPDDETRASVIHQASAELGMHYADFTGSRTKRPYKEGWKNDFAKTPYSRPQQLIGWMLPNTPGRKSPRLVTIDTKNFERTLAAYSDPWKAREIMTHAVKEVVPQISKDEKETDIWNVTHTFLINDQEYKVHYQYDSWFDGVNSQQFHIEGLSKS
jgi:hypothetical protein